MRRAASIALIIVSLAALGAWADCGCGPQPVPDPTCYETFRSNEIVEFTLIVPAEYFCDHDGTATPVITGWHVETLDGMVVEQVTYTEPRGHWESFTWDVTGSLGRIEAPAFYRIVVETRSAGDVSVDVQIVPCQCSFCCWGCWGCTWSPCGYCSTRCWPACCCPASRGDLYLVVDSAGTRSCGACTIEIFGHFEISTP
jgi:hypothetical protein